MALADVWYKWSQDDRRSWVAHAVIASALSLVFTPQVAIGYYFLRECEQVGMDAFVYHKPVVAHWFDHVMDVVSPTVAVLLLAFLTHYVF